MSEVAPTRCSVPRTSPGRRVLLVNDVVTTGDGFQALANATYAAGGEPVAAAWFISRSGQAD